MATKLGPQELLVETNVENTSEVKLSLLDGTIVGESSTGASGLANFTGVSISEATREPFLYFVEIDLPADANIPSLDVQYRGFYSNSQAIPVGTSGGSTYGKGTVFLYKGLRYMSFSNSWAVKNANKASDRAFNPTLFPVNSNVNIADNGIYNGKLYCTVIFFPFNPIPTRSYTTLYPEYTVLISVYGKRVIEITPPPPEPEEDDPSPEPELPPETESPPTEDIPDNTEEPEPEAEEEDEPEEPYQPPEETQLSVRVTDATSQALYGALPGPEFESEYIENTRQATRVAEQIIWQSNQTIILTFSIPYNPTIRRGQTIGVQSSLYAADNFIISFTALVKSYSHVFDANSGEVTTQIVARGSEYVFVSSLSESDPTETIDLRAS